VTEISAKVIIVAGYMDPQIVQLLATKGIEVIACEPQTTQTEDFARWLSDVQAEQARSGSRKETRPPWIRKATRRAPRKL
jgi:3-hydroxyacyl-CoA dehydrogenase